MSFSKTLWEKIKETSIFRSTSPHMLRAINRAPCMFSKYFWARTDLPSPWRGRISNKNVNTISLTWLIGIRQRSPPTLRLGRHQSNSSQQPPPPPPHVTNGVNIRGVVAWNSSDHVWLVNIFTSLPSLWDLESEEPHPPSPLIGMNSGTFMCAKRI